MTPHSSKTFFSSQLTKDKILRLDTLAPASTLQSTAPPPSSFDFATFKLFSLFKSYSDKPLSGKFGVKIFNQVLPKIVVVIV